MSEEEDVDQPDLTARQRWAALGSVVRLAFTVAPWAVALSAVGIVIDSVLPILTTFFAAKTTTVLAEAVAGESGAAARVYLLIGITAGLGVVQLIWGAFHGYVSAKLRFLIDAKINDQLLEQFAALEFWRYDDVHSADLYEKASRFASFFSTAFDKFASVASGLTATVAGIVALATVNPWLALAVLLGVTPGVWVQLRLSRREIAHWNDNVGVRRAKQGIERGLLNPRAIVEVRSLGLVRHLMELRARLRDQDERVRIDMERNYLRFRLLADLIEALVVVGSLVWITMQIVARNQALGQFLFVQQVVTRAIEGANSLVSAAAEIDQDVANLFDYTRFMALPKPGAGGLALGAAPAVVSVENLGFSYPGSSRLVLDGVSLSIQAGQHVAIVGENGAGKSTLVKLLLGQYAPNAGAITLDGTDLREVDGSTWHEHVGYLRQEFTKFPFATVRDNVRFGRVSAQGDEPRIWEALDAAQAADFVRALPQGLDTIVDPLLTDDLDGDVGVELSGGQWQRLALARIFYRDPEFLLLDEPTSAVDAIAERAVFEHIFNRMRRRTVISVSHRLATIRPADVIFVLVAGRLVERGTHQELINSGGAYSAMFGHSLSD